MQGRRREEGTPVHELEPGDYVKQEGGHWWLCLPSGDMGRINDQTSNDNPKWDVVEHEDGTITVQPSIRVAAGEQEKWHGWLTSGVWSSC